MSAAWAAELSLPEKMVLLALADAANDEGLCWPSVATIYKKCSMAERTVRKTFARLVELGHLTIHERVGRSNYFTVHPIGAVPVSLHYVYRLTDARSGEFYIGVRSCSGSAETDEYWGSGTWAKARSKQELRKEILETFADRLAAQTRERELTRAAIHSPLCRNQKVGGSDHSSGWHADTPARGAPLIPLHNVHTPPAPDAPPPLHVVQDTPARGAPINIIEPSVEPPINRQRARGVGKVSRGAESPDWFLDFKLAYPERNGDPNWRGALSAANARMAEGHTPAEFLAGARRYAAHQEAAGKVGTEYVQQASRFLGPSKPFLLPWKPPPKPENATERLLRGLNDSDSRVIEHDPERTPALTFAR